ncbi:MAG: acyl transferase, partial [bacterium]|nr:acyl transferase [bacterium]
LVLLELDERFTADLERLALHPALLDVATGVSRGLAEWQDYLPMSYGTLRLHRPLPHRFYSHLRGREETAKRQTLSFDVTLLDEDGTELVTIEQFTMKRVGAATERLAQPAPAPEPEPAAGVAGRLAEVGITPEEGPQAWRRILAHHRGPQIVAMPVNFATLMAEQAAAPSLGAPARPVGDRHERPRLATDYVAPRNPVEQRLAETWQELLGIERVGIHDDFIELGGHSLLAVQMVAQLEEKLGVKVSLPMVFEAQTVAELAGVIGAAQPQPEAAVPGIGPVPRDAVPL